MWGQSNSSFILNREEYIQEQVAQKYSLGDFQHSFGHIVVVIGSFLHCLENFTDVNMYLNCTLPFKIVNCSSLLLLIQNTSYFTMQCIAQPTDN